MKTLDSIFFFIIGYTSRAELENLGYSDCLDGFEDFVHGYYNDHSSRNWHSIIVLNTQTQEEAVDIFLNYWTYSYQSGIVDDPGSFAAAGALAAAAEAVVAVG